MFSLHPAIAFSILVGFLAIGDIVSAKTKAIIPSILIFLIFLLSGVWLGIIPTNIIELSGFSENLVDMIIVIIVVNMGSSLSVRELKKEWKTVLIGIGAMVGIALVVVPIGGMLFGKDIAIVAAPPIAGGFVAAFEMSKAALSKGLPFMSMIALLLLALQEFPTYFILPSLLKKEAIRNLSKYRQGEGEAIYKAEETAVTVKKRKPLIPEKYETESTILVQLGIFGTLAVLSSQLVRAGFTALNTPFGISPTIFALFYGVIAGEMGFIERKALQKANCFGFFIVASLIGVMGGLVNHTPQEILSVIGPIAGLIALGVVGMGIGGIIVGKLLKKTWEMSFAIALNCLIGFPINFLLTTEAINAVAETEEEKDYLTEVMLPSMLVGGFTTVTLGSVVFAEIAKNFL